MVDRKQLTGRADIHMHTTASDGFSSVEAVLDHIAKLGTLDVIAITDHDVLDSSLWAYNHRVNYPFEIIPGVEVSSAEGHVLALWVTQPIAKDMSLKDTVAAIHKLGGMAIVAHPFEVLVCTEAPFHYLRHPEYIREAGVDAIEIHNAGAFTPGNNILARRLAKQLNMTAVGNSDGHSLRAIGRGKTYFKGHTAADFRAALVSGETAIEGIRWPVEDYIRLFPRLVHDKMNALNNLGARLTQAGRS
ncbi:MAG: PHP-associated domain-containing protein [Chloroflexota bacterium]